MSADNMPAFPRSGHHQEGMSLRDWFAGQSLSGFCSLMHDGGEPFLGAADAAKAAYNYADAMLAERAKAEGRL